jgi:ribulose-5-phosphate 4-epimerase/fuculose-1-phosphate aldolase
MICAQLEDTIPLMSIEILVCGGPIPVAPWATPGTAKAGEVAVRIFQKQQDLRVLLLRKHGLLAIGNSLDQAYSMAANAEVGMEIYYKTRLVREPHAFSPAQLKEIREIYGN